VEERLQKFLARNGVASRRKSEMFILSGRVTVNGKAVTELGMKIDPEKDIVTVDGRKIEKTSDKVYLLLNKPSGYVCTARDEHRRPTVLDLVPKEKRVFPVGRLDMDTTGLLILINDGTLAYCLAHPRFNVPKTYLAIVKGVPDEQKLEAFASGLVLDDGPTAPCKVRIEKIQQGNAVLRITLSEGRKRQVKRMCQAIGHPVKSLVRIGIGQLFDNTLGIGEYRHLTVAEVEKLIKACRVRRKDRSG